MFTPRRLFTVVLIVAMAGLGFASYQSVGAPAAPKAVTATATVQRGVVLSSVTATGNASASTQLGLNFQASGVISEIDVQLGQQVAAGQVLAKLTDTTQSGSLTSANAGLASAQAKMAQDEAGATSQTVAQDQASLSQSQLSLANAQTTADQDAKTQQIAVDQAKQAVANAQANAAQDTATLQIALNQAQGNQVTQQDADQNTLNADTTTLSVDQQVLQNDQNAVQAIPVGNTTQRQAAQQKVQTDQAKISSDLAKLDADQLKITSDQQSVTTAQNNLTAGQLKDQQAIQTAQNQITNAVNSQQSTALRDQQSITTAQASLASAGAANAAKEAPATPATIAADQSSVTTARVQVTTAQTNVTATVLTAPVSGTVSTISGSVGTSASGSGASSSSSSSSSSASAGSASSSFITLTDLTSLQVVAGFSETDAAKVQLGQPATVSFNALPNQTMQGKVSAISINSQVVSNVVTYNVTVSVLNPPPTVKPGMTANIAVTTAQRLAVLTLPTSAITGTGSSTVVQVAAAKGATIPRTISVGMRGDTAVEIISGLNAGDKVVITRSSGGTPTNGIRLPTGAGGFGGLGGGLTGGRGG